MRASTAFFLLFAALLSACTCAPLGVNETRFACEADDECLEGFSCIDVGEGPECLPSDTERPDSGEAEDAGFDAGQPNEEDAGMPDGGEPLIDAGLEEDDAGTPDAGTLSLHFLTTQQNVAVGACSAITLVETRSDGAPWSVPSDLTLTLSSMPTGVRFSRLADCSTMTTSVEMRTGATNANFYMSAQQAGVYALRVSAPGFESASQDLEVGVSPQIITLANVPGQVRGGACTRGTVELRRAGALVDADVPVVVSLASMNASQVQFFTSSSCSTTTTSVTIAAGASSRDFWFKPLTANAQVISATASFDADQASFTSLPVVRRTGCYFAAASTLADGGVQAGTLSRSCTLPVPLIDTSTSFLVSQFVPNSSVTQTSALSLRCRISSTTQAVCTRNGDSSSGNAYVQVAEIPQNLKVQRAGSSSCPATIALSPLDAGVEPFLLRAVSSGTPVLNGNHTAVARYAPPDVSTTPSVCGGYEHQLVEWRGVEVTAGSLDGGFAAGQSEVTVTGLPAVSTDAVLLVQAGLSNSNEMAACSLLVKGDMTTPTSVRLSRGAGDAGCPLGAVPQVTWQRIDFDERADVDTYKVTFAPQETSKTITIAPVDSSRTMMMTSSQSFAGQGAGETDEGSSVRASAGTVSFSLMSSTTLQVTRGASGSTSSFVIYVVELTP
ncbi:MAG: hypothetical protein ACO1OB_03670 [Archangium sp.]